MYIAPGFQADDLDLFDMLQSDYKTGSTIQLLPDKKLGSHRIFLKIHFPAVRTQRNSDVSAIMGVDMGLRDLATYAIRSQGAGTESPDKIPINLQSVSSTSDSIITGSVSTPDYALSDIRLNRQSKLLQQIMTKFQTYVLRKEEEFDKKNLPFTKLLGQDFTSEDPRFYRFFNYRKAISSNQQKKSAVNDTTTHIATKDLLTLALLFNVRQFKFEDLSFFQRSVPAGAREWSYRYSSNLFGQVFSKLEYKLFQYGFDQTFKKHGAKKDDKAEKTLAFVNPYYTSQLCPVGLIERNQLLSWKFTERNKLKGNSMNCKHYRRNVDGSIVFDNMGKLFIHKPHFSEDVKNLPDKEVRMDRDAAAAINLTYC